VTRWQEVDVWSFIGRNEAELLVHESDEHVAAMREYRDTECIVDCYLADPSGYDEDGMTLDGAGGDLTCAGPQVGDIDWAGLDEVRA
jgi:hypothetical protein